MTVVAHPLPHINPAPRAMLELQVGGPLVAHAFPRPPVLPDSAFPLFFVIAPSVSGSQAHVLCQVPPLCCWTFAFPASHSSRPFSGGAVQCPPPGTHMSSLAVPNTCWSMGFWQQFVFNMLWNQKIPSQSTSRPTAPCKIWRE